MPNRITVHSAVLYVKVHSYPKLAEVAQAFDHPRRDRWALRREATVRFWDVDRAKAISLTLKTLASLTAASRRS